MINMLQGDQSNIIVGPEHDFIVPEEPFAEMVWNSLRNRDPEDVVNLDPTTKETLTCIELLKRSVKLIQVLKKFNLGQEDTISIISENNLNFNIPLVAGILMGVTVSPINPDYSIGEIIHALNISKPKVVFCTNHSLDNVIKAKKELDFINFIILMNENHTCFDNFIYSLEKLLQNEVLTNLDNFKPAQDGSFIYLSSGTTGLSKGALITHSNIKEGILVFLSPKHWNINAKDRTVLPLPCFHLFGTLIQLAAILSGMKIVLMNRFRPEVFLKSIEEYKINKLYLAPPLLLFLINNPAVDNYNISSLEDIMVSAAPVGKDLQMQALKRLGPIIRVCYAMTETSGTGTIQPKDNVIPATIGTLAPRLLAKVWDPVKKQNLEPFQVGELCFKGPAVIRCYVGNAKATKESFDEEGFYHSGDVGYYDSNGQFYMVGRTKEIIKYKGFQVSPVELEALISTHPLVKECGVIGIPDERAGELPLAFVVPRDNCKVTSKEIVEFVAERISVQKRLYGGVRFINEIPRNVLGKILRRELLDIYNNE